MRIEALTFLRFIAAAIVVVFHYGLATNLARAGGPFVTAGPQMVSFFFTLSGFVLMAAYYRPTGPGRPLADYYLSRLARIAPVYLLSLFALAVMVEWTGDNTPIAFLLNALFLQSWFPPHASAFNPPGWSLSVEAFFYLTFPFIVWVLRASRMLATRFVGIAVTFFIFSQAVLVNLLNNGFYAGFPSLSHDLIFYFPLSHYCSFVLGVAGGYVFCTRAQEFARPGAGRTAFMLFMLLIVYALIAHEAAITHWIGVQLPFGASFHSLAFIVLILSVAAADNGLTRLLSWRPLVILGEASYGLYILQDPVRVVFDRYVAPRAGLSEDGAFYVYAAMLLVASIASFYWIEKPVKSLLLSRRAQRLETAVR